MNSYEPDWMAYEEAHPIIVPDDWHDPHPMTVKTASTACGDWEPTWGVRPVNDSWTLNGFRISVCPPSIERALRLVDAFAKACDERGFGFASTGRHDPPGLMVVVDGEPIGFMLSERMARSLYRPTKKELGLKERGELVHWPKYQYEPSGELTLGVPRGMSMGTQKSWRDSPRRKLETQLNKIMLGLRVIAAEQKERKRSSAEYSQRIDAFHERREALRERVEAEQEAVAQLEADADAWRRAWVIRNYIAVVEAQPTPPEGYDDIVSWAAWARQQADRIDPLTPSPPSILDTPEEDYEPGDSMWGPPLAELLDREDAAAATAEAN